MFTRRCIYNCNFVEVLGAADGRRSRTRAAHVPISNGMAIREDEAFRGQWPLARMCSPRIEQLPLWRRQPELSVEHMLPSELNYASGTQTLQQYATS